MSIVIEPTEYGPPESADGTLIIVICRAKHLPNRRKLDKQSPYVTVRLGTTAQKTPSHFRAGQTPEWTHEMRFTLTRDRKPLLKLDVLDETKNDPTPIGNVEIDCSVIFASPDNHRDGKYIYDKWYDMTCNGRRAGMIYLEMTFYPSAPVLPPKVPFQQESETAQYYDPAKYSRTPSPAKSFNRSIADEVFVTSQGDKKSSFFKHSGGSTGTAGTGGTADTTPFSSSHGSADDEPQVFVSSHQEELKGTKKYTSKFNKLKSKFSSKEPITKLWQSPASGPGSPGRRLNFSPKQRSVSPISEYDIDNLDQLQRDISQSQYDPEYDPHEPDYDPTPGPPPPPPHSAPSAPAPPPHRIKTSVSSNMDMYKDVPLPSPPKDKGPGRKAPEDLYQQFTKLHMDGPPPPPKTTAVPFSADSIGLDDDDDVPVPTEVYLMGKPAKSLTTSPRDDGYKLNPNEIDPRFYAPTPSEHLNSTLRLQNGTNLTKKELETDLRTSRTGYLGDGKFSPSIFERAVQNNDADSDVVDDDYYNGQSQYKPRVPPKVPQGLTELEYYVLEKEKYLKDLQGRRH